MLPIECQVGAAVGMATRSVERHVGELVGAGYLFRDCRYNKSCITDFNWERVNTAKSDPTKMTGDTAKSDGGYRQKWRDDTAKSGGLTTESNHGTQALNLTLPKEREGSRNQEQEPDTGYHGTPDNVQHGVESTATNLSSNPDTSPGIVPDTGNFFSAAQHT